MKLLEQFDGDQFYSEISQVRPCKFAFALIKDDVVQVNHKPVICRDFLNDSLCWISGEVKHDNVYGYCFNGEIEKEFTSLVIYDYGNLFNNIFALNLVEEELGLPLTDVTVITAENGKMAAVVEGPKFWMKTTVHFSLYTTILRGLTYNQEIPTLADIPREQWMSDVHGFIPKLPKILLDMPVDKVTGCAEVDEGDLEGTLHEFNGWATACTSYKHRFNRYGEYIYGKLSQA